MSLSKDHSANKKLRLHVACFRLSVNEYLCEYYHI